MPARVCECILKDSIWGTCVFALLQPCTSVVISSPFARSRSSVRFPWIAQSEFAPGIRGLCFFWLWSQIVCCEHVPQYAFRQLFNCFSCFMEAEVGSVSHSARLQHRQSSISWYCCCVLCCPCRASGLRFLWTRLYATSQTKIPAATSEFSRSLAVAPTVTWERPFRKHRHTCSVTHSRVWHHWCVCACEGSLLHKLSNVGSPNLWITTDWSSSSRTFCRHLLFRPPDRLEVIPQTSSSFWYCFIDVGF